MTQNKTPKTIRKKRKDVQKDRKKPEDTSRVKFSATSPVAQKQSIQIGDDGDGIGNTSDLTNSFRSVINGTNSPYQTNSLQKSVQPITIRNDVKNKSEKTKIMFSAKNYHYSHDGVEIKGFQRLTDAELRDVANVDPYISAIISTRCSQASVVARPSDSKFDKGTRILDINQKSLNDFDSAEEFEKYQQRKENQQKAILDWLQSCGTDDEEILHYAYGDPRSDQIFKKCTLADYVAAQVRNLLTFGRMGTQIIHSDSGVPLFFRPAPIETIYPVVDKDDVHVGLGDNTYEDSLKDAEAYNALPRENRQHGFIQRIDGVNANFYTEEEMKIDYFQKQALFDLRGFPLAPIEMAIYMAFIHQQTLNYLKNQFIKGLGTKGVLTLESNDVAAELSQEDLEDLRRDFHNFLNGNDNAAATPVLAGPVKINWIPLSAVPRDMEFLQVEEHVIRALCAAFQTSPQEMGYGHLSMNQGSLSSQNKQDEIIQGEERGLRMLLDIIYDRLNLIMQEHFPGCADNFRVTYTGVGEDTREAVVQRHNNELNTTATLGSMYADSEKNEQIPMGADVPLSPHFHQYAVKYMKYGHFMEKFFGMEGWGDKEEYDFIIDPALNQSYTERMSMNKQMQRKQGKLQIQTQESQLDMLEAQTDSMEAQEQQMAMGGDGQEGGDPQMGGVPPEQGEEETDENHQGGAPQDIEKARNPESIKDAYFNKQRLQKSLDSYFGAWIRTHHNHVLEEGGYDDEPDATPD